MILYVRVSMCMGDMCTIMEARDQHQMFLRCHPAFVLFLRQGHIRWLEVFWLDKDSKPQVCLPWTRVTDREPVTRAYVGSGDRTRSYTCIACTLQIGLSSRLSLLFKVFLWYDKSRIYSSWASLYNLNLEIKCRHLPVISYTAVPFLSSWESQ